MVRAARYLQTTLSVFLLVINTECFYVCVTDKHLYLNVKHHPECTYFDQSEETV